MPSIDSSITRFFAKGSGSQLLSHLSLAEVPSHVAIIMDGNGRWARLRGLPRLAGHRAGAKAVREAIATALELGIKVLTIYSFSSENWARPAEEIAGLMNLFVEVLRQELENLERMEVKVTVAGDIEGLPTDTRAAFENCVSRTSAYDRMTLVVALNYGGRAEILGACKAIAEACVENRLSADMIDEGTFAAHLFTRGIPDPDLVIRTSGEMRVSNFLLWQIAYSELWVTDVLWPDFDRHELLRAIVDFQGRNRRFGRSS